MATWLCPLLMVPPFLLLMWWSARDSRARLAAHIAELTLITEPYGFRYWTPETLEDFKEDYRIEADYFRDIDYSVLCRREVDGVQHFFAQAASGKYVRFSGDSMYAFDVRGDLPSVTLSRRPNIKHRPGLSAVEQRWRGKGDEFIASLAADARIANTLCYDDLFTYIDVKDRRVLFVMKSPCNEADYHSRLRIAMRLADEFNRWASGEYARWQAMSDAEKQAWRASQRIIAYYHHDRVLRDVPLDDGTRVVFCDNADVAPADSAEHSYPVYRVDADNVVLWHMSVNADEVRDAMANLPPPPSPDRLLTVMQSTDGTLVALTQAGLRFEIDVESGIAKVVDKAMTML